MKLKNISNIPNYDVLTWLGKYRDHFSVEVDNSMNIRLNSGNRPFVNHPKGILMCNPHDLQLANVDGFGGFAYTYGAVSVFVYPYEKVKWNGRASYLYENRLVHEILHHFDKPCHDIENWIDELPLFHRIKYHIFWYIIGGRNGESLTGSWSERAFYKHLLEDVNEEEFDKEYCIEERDYMGVLYE